MKRLQELITPSEYRALADFRRDLRVFLAFSEQAARAAGLEPRQYQMLLAIKGRAEEDAPTVGALSREMGLRHHSAVELIDRMETNGLVSRTRSPSDRRQVLVQLTARGQRLLARLARVHRQELQQTAPRLIRTLRRVLNRAPAKSGRPGKARAPVRQPPARRKVP